MGNPKKLETTANRLKLAIFNDSQQVLKRLCHWFEQRGHDCATARVADMPRAHIEVATFISSVAPDVVIYDVAKPYQSSWDLLSVIRKLPSIQLKRFVVTTPNSEELHKAVGLKRSVLEVAGQPADIERLVKTVERVAAA